MNSSITTFNADFLGYKLMTHPHSVLESARDKANVYERYGNFVSQKLAWRDILGPDLAGVEQSVCARDGSPATAVDFERYRQFLGARSADFNAGKLELHTLDWRGEGTDSPNKSFRLRPEGPLLKIVGEKLISETSSNEIGEVFLLSPGGIGHYGKALLSLRAGT